MLQDKSQGLAGAGGRKRHPKAAAACIAAPVALFDEIHFLL
jgi:hypothetical protein